MCEHPRLAMSLNEMAVVFHCLEKYLVAIFTSSLAYLGSSLFHLSEMVTFFIKCLISI